MPSNSDIEFSPSSQNLVFLRIIFRGSYVRPWANMWEQRCIDVHQITYDDDRIQSAEGIERVWQQFTSWFYREVVAWNGETCDLKRLWKIT